MAIEILHVDRWNAETEEWEPWSGNWVRGYRYRAAIDPGGDGCYQEFITAPVYNRWTGRCDLRDDAFLSCGRAIIGDQDTLELTCFGTHFEPVPEGNLFYRNDKPDLSGGESKIIFEGRYSTGEYGCPYYIFNVAEDCEVGDVWLKSIEYYNTWALEA